MFVDPADYRTARQESWFDDVMQEARYLVCQGAAAWFARTRNRLDASAHDLRQEIYEMLQSALTTRCVLLVDRYGDFVLYRPPVKANTMALGCPARCCVEPIVLIAVQENATPGEDTETKMFWGISLLVLLPP
jgi:cytochrome c-type biogenesis protein CcmH